MEVVTSLSTNINGANGGTKKHIQEWSRLDKLTGMLEHARVEADHWASNTSNSRHHFGKVVDSRARNLADGSVQQKQQTKQLEVFQAHIPGGSVQVIRSHTSTTSSWHNSKVLQSQSSNWSSSPADNLLNRHIGDMEVQIDNLKFDHNPVNLDSQKSKANVARHLGNRRPPTRSKMPRINHDNTVSTYLPITYNFHEVNEENKNKLNNDIAESTDSTEISSFSSSANASIMESNRKKLDKKKSISNENLSLTSHADSEEADEKNSSYPWIRSSLARRSYQHPPTSRYKMKMENSAEFVPGNKSDLENVLGKVLRHRADFESWSKMPSSVELQKPTPLLHKKSFVTEATLQETKRKLRPLTNDETRAVLRSSLEEIDDGVFTESKSNSDKENEKTNISEDLDDMVIKSTSSKCLDFRLVNKSDDWLDRRKSYGFEPVGQPNIVSSLNSTPKTNSSTDSGICRSSELELASTSIVKKVTETKDDCVIHSSKDKEIKPRSESTVKNEVFELLKKLEKFDKLKTSGATNVKFTESQDVIKKGKVLEAIKNFEKNGINHKTPELTSLTKSGSYFLEDLNEKTSQLAIEPDFLAKRHSIACDDTKYVASTITIPEPSLPEKAPLPGKSKIVNLNNFESGNASSPFTDTDAKKPKKVEFSRTEVHFAATEPGKIRIVETDEKPPPTNLYRKKKRSISVSPKNDSPQTKSSVFENLLNPENSQNNNLDEDSPGFRSHFTSTVSDNGLAVTITSAKLNDYRRASWSVIENPSSSPVNLENKVGYSTKINFGGEGVTVVADAKSAPREKPACESHISTTKTTNKTKISDTSHNNENINERLIVSIGGSASGNRTTGKYVQKPTFTNSFQNSIKSTKAAVGLEKLPPKKNDSLKSTSLIISTIKQSVKKKPIEKSNNEILMKENKTTDLKIEKSKPTSEQPSTYITEMNKLQRKYRVKENQSTTNGVAKNDKTKNCFYNTIPAVKNGHARTKLLTNDLPAVLSAFDTLCRTIDEVMERKTKVKHQKTQDHLKIVENLSIPVKSFYDEHSSQSRFLNNSVSQEDGNISDDSLKADKEVQSYMSTVIMEEYENELCGSWSRKRYFKHIKPIKIVQQDEISEKCHFKPLKNDADEFKIIANVTDIKKPKIALVATIQLNTNSPETENSSTISKKSTILLNKSPRIEGVFKDAITKEDDDVKKTHTSRCIGIADPNSSKINDYVNVADYRKLKQQNHLTRASVEEFSKNDSGRVEVIHHDIKLTEKVGRKENEKKPYLMRKDVGRESMKHGEKIASKDSIVNNGSIRRSTKSVNIKGKLSDSGRDSWLNLPKERKTLFEKKPSENGKHEIYRKPHIDHVKKDRRTRSGINGCGDISSEDDLMKKSSKVYIPLSTIHEKSQIAKSSKLPITKMASNSCTENQSSLFEFKNPVLKTEERSRRRAARILQRASSREMLMSSNIASSSDDVTSENEHHHLRISKPRSIRKSKSSPKTTKSVSATSNLPPKKTVTSSAKMQINIFNIKDRINNEIRSTHAHNTSSKSSNCADDVKSSKCRPPTSRQKTYANVPENSRTKLVSCSNRDSKNLPTMAVKSTRPIR